MISGVLIGFVELVCCDVFKIQVKQYFKLFGYLTFVGLRLFLFCIVWNQILMLRFQELLVILFLIIVVKPFQPKIRIMTVGAAVTVLWGIKEPGGTLPVMTPAWTVCIITENIHQVLMVSTGEPLKEITIPLRELRWKSDQCTFNFACLLSNANKRLEKKSHDDWVIKITEKEDVVLSLFIIPMLNFPPSFPPLS